MGSFLGELAEPSAPLPVAAASPGAKESRVSGKIHVMDIAFPGTSVIRFSFRDDRKSHVLFPVWTWSR